MGTPNVINQSCFITILQMIYDAQLVALEGRGRINDEGYFKAC